MKTVKFLAALFFISGFVFNNAKAQNQKSEYPEYWANRSYPCLTETISGTLILQHYTWGDRHLVKAEGTMTGDITGKEYYLSTSWDYVEIIPGNPPFIKWIRTLMLRDGNKLVLKIHQTIQGTIDENGNYVVRVDKENVDCK
jgi:hypothetical protein